MAEALGGRYDTPHGVANAVFLPTVIEFNAPADYQKHADVARYLGVDTSGMSVEEAALAAADALAKLCRDVDIPKFNELPGVDPVISRRSPLLPRKTFLPPAMFARSLLLISCSFSVKPTSYKNSTQLFSYFLC